MSGNEWRGTQTHSDRLWEWNQTFTMTTKISQLLMSADFHTEHVSWYPAEEATH